MEVQSVSFSKYGVNETFTLRNPEQKVNKNCFTIINGNNGTGKSAILRIISDAALGSDVSRQSNMFISNIKIAISGKISRTIALSGTHNDRFPLNSGIDLRQNLNKFDILPFYYYGPKQYGNYTSVFKASNTISHSLLSENNKILPISLVMFLKYIGFKPKISISFQMGNRSKVDVPPSYFQDLQKKLDHLKIKSSGPTKISDTLYHSISLAQSIVNSRFFKSLFLDPKEEKYLTFDLSAGKDGLTIYNDVFFDFFYSNGVVPLPQFLADLIALGIISTRVSLIRNDSEEKIALEELSSGEWQLIYSLLNLAINVDDNSLILVDEPENSLHPQWQTEYVRIIRDLVSHCVGCHIIIATHSPLIAASIMPQDGNLIRLERSQDTNKLRVEMEDIAYGWLPEDVLKERFDIASVRPPELTQAVNRSLKLLKYSSEISPELTELASQIKIFRKLLPLHDPLISVMNAIIAISSEKK